MHKYAALILLFASLTGLQAQSADTLNANNIKAGFGANGNLFEGGLVAPKSSLFKSVAKARFWIGGKNGSTLHISAQGEGGQAFWPGPLDTTNAAPADTNLWDEIYAITASEINTHRSDWNKQGYTLPTSIKQWPGTDTTSGFKRILGPFVDYNGNGWYDPQNGDYPVIKGDQAIYFVCNDKANAHLGVPLGVEIRGLAYVFKNPGMETTLFMELGFINRSANNYTDVYAGIYTDFSLGNPSDDYMGTLPSKNAWYVYNADNDDADYGVNPPTQAAIFLNHPLQYSIQIDPSAVSGSDTNRGLPAVPQEYYNFLTGKWRDGTPITAGVNGYKTAGAVSSHIFTGDPCNVTGWIEGNSSLPAGRRIALGSAGPFNLPSKEFIKLDVAFVWSRDTGSPGASICRLFNDINTVTAFYNSEISSVTAIQDIAFYMYPNPASDKVVIQTGEDVGPVSLEITDNQGRVLHKATFEGKTAVETSHLPPGVYFIRLSNEAAVQVEKLLIGR